MLSDILTAAAMGRGAASASVIRGTGGEPETFWVPDSADEPAFLAYSITKTFISAIVLKLHEEGRLRLDDPLAQWFPRIDRAERISLRQLLNHSAGIPDYGGLTAYHDSVRRSPSTPWSFERFAAETFEKGLRFEPGQGWAYSNPGYMLLKRITENVTGMSFGSLVAQQITGPLQLSRTFLAEYIDHLASLAPGTSTHLSPNRWSLDVRKHYHPGWVSHGVVASTASDIVRFFDGLFRGQIVSPDTLKEMTTLITVPGETDPNSRWVKPSYGLGLMADPHSPWGSVFGHNGGGPCYSACAIHAVDLGSASICVMGAIEENFDAENVVLRMLDRLAGRLR